MNKASSAEDYKLNSSFEAVRTVLLDSKYSDRLQKPLAYWALPNDRRLPLAFLGRTVAELLNTPFDELSKTAGIGQKKISSLVKLLHRATHDNPPEIPFGLNELTIESQRETVETQEKARKFDPSIVSEALWSKWRNTVRDKKAGHELLGRLAPTLQALPTVIWYTPLSFYSDYSIAEIRELKTHGEKRVRVVLEVFYVVHEMMSNMGTYAHLDARLVPKFIPPIEQWIAEVKQREQVPAEDEIRDRLVLPLLEQINVDAGPTVYQLAEGRLGVNEAPQSVRTQSRKMSVTRARVYQLLDDCSKVMGVRWPEGERQLAELAAGFKELDANEKDLALFQAMRELFFPGKYSSLEEDQEAELVASNGDA